MASIRKCLVCGKEFKNAAHENRKYCSHKCHGISQRVPRPLLQCPECGAWFHYSPRARRKRFCSQACSLKACHRKRRQHPPHWYINKRGYIVANIWVGGRRTQIKKHRWLMEQHLGRRLSPSEIVHHRDGNPLNNAIENLELMNQSDHMAKHEPKRICTVLGCGRQHCARGYCRKHWEQIYGKRKRTA